MTSWSVAGSKVRYWQCPFCGRTHSSLYSEVFDRGAGARRVDALSVSVPSSAGRAAPQATPEEIRWARLKARAARWFARLESEAAPSSDRASAPSGTLGPVVAAGARPMRRSR